MATLVGQAAAATSASGRGAQRRVNVATNAMTMPSVSMGTKTAATVSAFRSPAKSRTTAIDAAIGTSSNRDQCIESPTGGFIRCWLTSNQPCPFSQSRTSTSRMTSSGSGNRNASMAA